MELDTVAKLKRQFYRLTGTESGDQALTRHGETADEVAELALTRGTWSAQRWMLRNGYGGWRKRTSALSFTGTDADDGGKSAALPADFLKLYGHQRAGRSALVEANGDRWGLEIEPDEDHFQGDYYYVRGDELWLARRASPPGTLFADYHFRHPSFEGLDDGDIDFPLEARPLIPVEAAYVAMTEDWLPGEDRDDMIVAARNIAREEARKVARRTKQPRTMFKPKRFANRW